MTISVVVLIAVHAAMAQGGDSAACSAHGNPWTPSEVLWSGPWDERGPSPYSVAASATTTYIVAENPVVLAGMDSVRDGAMLGIAIPRSGKARPRVITTPPGHLRFRFPKIAVDDEGTLHMLWDEVSYTPKPDGDLRLVSVWAASYRNEKWKVEKLTEMEGIWWTATGVSDIVRTDNGELHFVAPEIRSVPFPFLLYVTRRFGRWSAMKVPQVLGAAYTTLAARHDSLFVGVIAPAREPRDVNSVWVAVSPDAGRSWKERVLVSRSYELAARELRITPDESGPVSVVWAQKDAPTEFLASVVRIATSRDGARTWSAPSTLTTAARQVYLVATAPRAPGAIDALYSADEALTIARACGVAWSKPFSLRDSVPSAGPAALLAQRGERPQVFWDAPALDSTLPPTRYWLRSILR